jgi:hypothetical protein
VFVSTSLPVMVVFPGSGVGTGWLVAPCGAGVG